MADFITRVELHGVRHNSEEYKTLHQAMEAEGFSRQIDADNGLRYHLPTAEYLKSGDLTKDQVFDAAVRAAEKTDVEFSILVLECNENGIEFYGLKEVKKKVRVLIKPLIKIRK